MDSALVGSGYADHLTDADLGLLATAADQPHGPGGAVAAPPPGAAPGAGRRPAGVPGRVRPSWRRPARRPAGASAMAALASPFLIFAVAVHRAAAELATMDHVPERSGQRQRVPLFDAPELRDFLGSAARRLFLAELLASFTRNAAGSTGPAPRGRPAGRRAGAADQRARPGPDGRAARYGPRGRTGRGVPQARRRGAVPDRGVSRLRRGARARAGQRGPAAARGAGAGAAARSAGRGAGHRPVRVPRRAVVPRPPGAWRRPAPPGSRSWPRWPTDSGRPAGC